MSQLHINKEALFLWTFLSLILTLCSDILNLEIFIQSEWEWKTQKLDSLWFMYYTFWLRKFWQKWSRNSCKYSKKNRCLIILHWSKTYFDKLIHYQSSDHWFLYVSFFLSWTAATKWNSHSCLHDVHVSDCCELSDMFRIKQL